MNAEIAIAGSGGQGVLLIGRLLAEAGLIEGHEVVWLPFYGAEKRGGTVSCNVIISDETIGSLFVTRPTVAVAMNTASLEKLEPALRPHGALVVNQSMISREASRRDIRVIYVPANELAAELADISVGNMIILGALIAAAGTVSPDSIITVMGNMFSRDRKHLEKNKLAVLRGCDFVSKSNTAGAAYRGR